MLNLHIIAGHLGTDPDQKGKGPVKFSVATNEVYTDRDGNKVEKVAWHNVEVWNKLGEICLKFLAKGKPVILVGQTATEKYEDNDGNVKYFTKFTAREMKMLGGKAAAATGSDEEPVLEDEDDEIPF